MCELTGFWYGRDSLFGDGEVVGARGRSWPDQITHVSALQMVVSAGIGGGK